MYMHKPFAYVSNSLIGIYTVSEKNETNNVLGITLTNTNV